MSRILDRAVFSGLKRLDPERAHDLVLDTLERFPSLAPRFNAQGAKPQFLGRAMSSLVGLAAGMDKDARALLAWKQMGFGFVEVGTVTLYPREGNPSPRIWRGEGGDLFNFMGLPNRGAGEVFERISAFRRTPQGRAFPLGLSLATPENNPGDLTFLSKFCAPLVDYIAYNGSCPNVRDHDGATALQHQVTNVLAIRQGAPSTPVFVKLAPTRDEKALFIAVLAYQNAGATGFIACNTIRPDAAAELLGDAAPRDGAWPTRDGVKVGGLSGPRLLPVSVGMVRAIREQVGPDVPIIGVGGIRTPASAVAMMEAGANAVQVFTALTQQGPDVVRQIHGALQRRPSLIHPACGV